jgi:tetratricopeptide (TPR) repeat protein
MRFRTSFRWNISSVISVSAAIVLALAASAQTGAGSPDSLRLAQASVPGSKAGLESKAKNAPDDIFLAVKQAKEKYENGFYGQALDTLKAELVVLEKKEKNSIAVWLVLSDMNLCLEKLHQEEQSAETARRCEQLSERFKLAPLQTFELIPENESARASVSLMAAMTATRAWQQHLVRSSDGSWAVTQDAPPQWLLTFMSGARLKQEGHYSEAEPLLKRAVREAEEAKARPADLGKVYSLLAGNYRYLKHYDESIATYTKALAIIEQSLGKVSAPYATILDNLSQVYDFKGDYAQAAKMQLESLDIYKKVLPANSPDLGQTMCSYASTLIHLGRLAESEQMYLNGIKIYRSTLPEDDMILAIEYDNLGGLYFDEHKLADAESYKRKALSIFQKKLSPTHPELSLCIYNLASVLVAQDKFDEAVAMMEEHLSRLKAQGDSGKTREFADHYQRLMTVILSKKAGH